MSTIVIPIDIENAGSLTIAFYEYLIEEKSNSPRMAEMLALRAAPRCMTDAVYFEGQGTLAKQFDGDERMLDVITKKAIARGYKPNNNDHYNSALADSLGDPKAFVPATGGRGHIKAVCEERGLACDGAVKVKGRQSEDDPKKIRLAESIIRQEMRSAIKNNPDKARMDKRDLRADVISKHGGK